MKKFMLVAHVNIIRVAIVLSVALNSTCRDIVSSFRTEDFQILESNENRFLSRFNNEGIQFIYEASTQGMVTKSKLNIVDLWGNQKRVTELNFFINEALPAYKLIMHDSVLVKANINRLIFDQDLIDRTFHEFEVFGELLLNSSQTSNVKPMLTPLFFYRAILSTIKRSIQTKTDCGCTPHPAYFIDKINFWCQEDFLINPQTYIKAIDDAQYPMNEVEKRVYQFLLNRKNTQAISIDTLLNMYEPKDEFMQRVKHAYIRSTLKGIKVKHAARVAENDCTKGSDLGCCGNYSGCCWYWTMLCLAHDVACLKCDHWYCGWQCKPES